MIKLKRENKIEINFNPKVVVQIGDYSGLILTEYSENGKYETLISLVIVCESKESICFYADMNYEENYTIVKSFFGHLFVSAQKVKKIIGNIPFEEVSDKLETFLPINLQFLLTL